MCRRASEANNRLALAAFGVASLPLTFLFASQASAIVADPAPRTCSAFSRADIVVAGLVKSQRTTPSWDIWSVEVGRRYKGNVANRLEFRSPNDSARATPDVGQRNILFLHRVGPTLIGWGSDPNSGGVAGRRIEREVQALGKGQGPGSMIGLLARENGSPFVNWRIALQRTGSRKIHYVPTDMHGRFTSRLSPGTWRAWVDRSGWTSRGSLYSYDDPTSFVVRAGGCADIRLEPVAR